MIPSREPYSSFHYNASLLWLTEKTIRLVACSNPSSLSNRSATPLPEKWGKGARVACQPWMGEASRTLLGPQSGIAGKLC